MQRTPDTVRSIDDCTTAFKPRCLVQSSSENDIESLNASLRKVTKTRRSFPTDESVMKVLYLALHQIAKKWTMPIRDWKQAMTQFMILFGELLGQ